MQSLDDMQALIIRQSSATSKSTPRFLTRALSWVEYRRIALQQQGQYPIDSIAAGDYEALAYEQLRSAPQPGRDSRVSC